ncbi:hypothetical protein CWR48_14010 [Oceanobacillus arenosus]|uniref:HNH nuclease domain-containing protein n=1 Tax=Oceanobacillus arenosus TaxID=1229153 RepID=A0A3D8PNE4_9BACI|nr:HNH endonuclease [Oceanobacillus arenosus]RDW17626.1 hypothetical protein CWR48_14010 [Oceanobacillus arenosus]
MNNTTNEAEKKACTKCGIEKPFTNEYYAKDNRKKSGLRSACKECGNEYRRNNRGKVNQYLKEYHVKNKEKISNNKKKYYQENKEEKQAYALKYRKENIESIRAYKKKHKRENRDFYNYHKQKRRAIINKLPHSLDVEQWNEIKIRFNHKCAYCGMKLELQQEHFIPVSKGGEYTRNNIIPACIHCNSSKNDKNFFDWYPTYKYYSEQRESEILKFLNYESNKTQQLSIL